MTSKGSYGGGSTSLHDFKQINLLGEGAYSSVYKVQRLADGEIYALKKVKLPSLSDKERQNALNEVRLLASVKNPYIIDYKEAFFDDKSRCLCIVTEYADAGDLYQQIVRCQKERSLIPEVDVWRYLHGMCFGLKALHDMKILHRDMKCANVFLHNDQDGTIAKLGDFNVSKVAKRGLCMTQTGTPYYASPEVWKDMPYDAKSDMWSLGCVLYEMLGLKPPFRAEDMDGLYRKVLKGQYPRIPTSFSHDLSEVVGLLLQVNPRHRPSVDQLLQLPVMRRHASPTGDSALRPNNLLQTIKFPKNALDLPGCLPKPRYDLQGGVYEEAFAKSLVKPLTVAAVEEDASKLGNVCHNLLTPSTGAGGNSALRAGSGSRALLGSVQGSGGGGHGSNAALRAPSGSRGIVSSGGGGGNAGKAPIRGLDGYAQRDMKSPSLESLQADAEPRRPLGTPSDLGGHGHGHCAEDSPSCPTSPLRPQGGPSGLDSLDAYIMSQAQRPPQQPQHRSGRQLSLVERQWQESEESAAREAAQRSAPALQTPVAPLLRAPLPPPTGSSQIRQQRDRDRRPPMASYARSQYELNAQPPPPQPPPQPVRETKPSGGGIGLRLPRIFSKGT
eukprot:TRINITY_DN64078_c0_g1_i1.p1 TRINITY_DN64078_c0_g1~~TRINITY_DN64078_c0_g1_i1.p1  ORF type:complete len:613 (+),score=107.83 TRINITY_DN64078_c0_g1_i1:108-1946(+)